MNQQIKNHLETLNSLLDEIKRYSHCYALMSYDRETVCPVNAQENEGDTLQFLSAKVFAITNSDEYIACVKYLHDHIDELETIDQRLVTLLYRSYLDEINITPEIDAERNKIYTESYIAWIKAKNKDDYSLFAPNLKKIIAISDKIISLRQEKSSVPYDNYIGHFEYGMTSERLDNFFESLKNRIVLLLKKIKKSDVKIRTDFLTRKISIEKQEKFSKYLLDLIGFDFDCGLLGTTEHPFTSEIGYKDVRITTHYYEDLFLSNVFSVIHEVGHAIFGQSELKEYYDHHISNSMSMGMHESVSRFYENRIGRSKAFIHLIYPKFHEMFEEFADVSEEEFYAGINVVTPSLIRTEADELTYSLHILIRYELEKAIVEKKVTVEDLPNEWNRLYTEYLGVTPTSDKVGILQDVHWTSGFGYFPTYAMGNAYNSMYFLKMNKEFDVMKAVEDGNIAKVTSWMKKNVFKKASLLDPDDWIKDIVGKTLDPEPYLDYLEEKYSEIYKL